MTEQIGQKIVSLIKDIVPTYYSEAEVESYPYCTYGQEVSAVQTKDGILLYSSDCSVNIYSDVFDEADDAAAKVAQAIEDGMHSSQFSARRTSVEKTCTEGVWQIEIQYTIKQFS